MVTTLMATTPMVITLMVITPMEATMEAMEDIMEAMEAMEGDTGLMAMDTVTASCLGWVMATGAVTAEDITDTTDRSELRSTLATFSVQ